MEDSYTVHRRRKAAARKREKTPDPPRFSEDVSDDEETRARMEKMVEDTEKMEKLEEVERSEREPRRPTRKASLREEQGESGTEKHEPKVSTPRRSDLNVEEDTNETRDDDAREAARSDISKEVVSREKEEEEKLQEETVVDERAKSTLGVTEISGDAVEMAENRRNDEKSVKKRSKERFEGRRSYTTDSSDGEERGKGSSSRRKKSPEVSRSRSGGGRKPASRPRRMTDSDEDEDLDTSRNDSFTERSRSRSTRGRRSSGKHRHSIGTDEDSGPRKNDLFVEKTQVEVEAEEQTRRRQERAKIRDKRSTSRHKYPSDTDEDPETMKKSETFPQRTIEKPSIRRSASEMKKQIIPLSNDSLIHDFAKAQQEYLRKEVGILDPNSDPLEIFYVANEETLLRRRKPSVIHTDPEKKEIAKMPVPRRPWFSWLPFLRKKEKGTDEDDHPTKKERKKDLEKKVSFLEFLMVLRDAVSEFKAFVEQNPRETKVIRKLRNRCTAELVLMLIYCGLGAFVFKFTEGAFETFYKCGVKRVKRDFLDSLWNYSHNLREDDWKSMARKKLMEFEEQLHTAHEAGVHTYSGQRSWSFLNAVVYCLTVITTIGYGHISPSTTTGRALTILYAIFGIPMFLIILADFGKLFTRCIKFLWAFVRRVYYTGSCRKVRGTASVQEVMKGVQLVYDFATFRRPSQINPEDIEEMQRQGSQTQTVLNVDGNMPQPGTPGTPAMSNFAIDDEFNLPISVAIFILLVYIFVGATIYYMWEDWGFFESFYFVFISMSTIGFGDYVPQHPIYMMCSIVYLVFGLALTSMCINVVQVMLSDSFKQASQKIGATIGFEVSEDNGSIQAIAPPPVEIADVHTTISNSSSKEKIAPRAKQEDLDL